MVAKASLGVIGLGAISVGGVALAKPYLLGMADPMPEYHTLKDDNDFASSYNNGGTDKFGKKYGRYFVGVTTKSGGSKKNEGWWAWAYRRLSNKKPQPGKFENVDKGYGNTDNHLSKVCKDAYGTEESSFSDTGSTNFKKSEVWKYCSIGGTRPQTIQDFATGDNANNETYGTDTIGTDSTYKSKLLSIKSPANDWIWDLKNEDFFSASNNVTDGGYFQSEKGKTGEQRNSIKKICEDAYKKSESSSGTGAEKISKSETEKHCSLTGSSN